MKHIQRFEAFLTEGKETFKKGEKLTIDMGDGPEEVEVMDDFNAGLSQVKFISLKRKKGAPYTITTSKLMKILTERKDELAKFTMNNLDWGKSTAERNANLDKYDSLKNDKERLAFLKKLKGESNINEAEVLTVIDKGDKEREIRIIASSGYVTLTQKDFDGNILRFIVNNDQINDVVKALNKVK